MVRVGGDHAESREQGQAGDSFFVVEVDVCDFQGFGQRRGGQADGGDGHGDAALESDQVGAGGLRRRVTQRGTARMRGGVRR